MCCISAPSPSGASSGQKSASVASPGKPAIQRGAASASGAARGEGRRRNQRCCPLRKRVAWRYLMRREWSGGAGGARTGRALVRAIGGTGARERDLAGGPACWHRRTFAYRRIASVCAGRAGRRLHPWPPTASRLRSSWLGSAAEVQASWLVLACCAILRLLGSSSLGGSLLLSDDGVVILLMRSLDGELRHRFHRHRRPLSLDLAMYRRASGQSLLPCKSGAGGSQTAAKQSKP